MFLFKFFASNYSNIGNRRYTEASPNDAFDFVIGKAFSLNNIGLLLKTTANTLSLYDFENEENKKDIKAVEFKGF